MYKNRTTLTLIISSIVMIISIITLIFFFKIIANKNTHTSAVLTTLAEKMAKKNNIEVVRNKINEVDQTKNLISNYFVDSSKIDSFIDYLEKLGSSVGTEVKVENFETTNNKNSLSVRVTCLGTFSGIMNTILLLENAPYEIHITRASINQQLQPTSSTNDKPIKKSSAPMWQANISFTILTS